MGGRGRRAVLQGDGDNSVIGETVYIVLKKCRFNILVHK